MQKSDKKSYTTSYYRSYRAIRSYVTCPFCGPFASLLAILFCLALPTTALAQEPGYRIQPGDLLTISVWKEPDLQGEILVRPDGGFTFPLAGELDAVDHTVADLQEALAEKLKKFIPDPVVNIGIKLVAGNRIYVLGKVNRPGEFAMTRPVDVMQALSLAGGATPFASVNDIRILRREQGHQVAIPFRYNDVERGRGLEQNVLLQSGDTVVVP